MLSKRRLRALCVDEDEDNRLMMLTLLRLRKIEAKTVGTAPQALALVQKERFDLYLLEAWLPGQDGFDLCRQIRSSDSDAPIVFYSAAGFEEDKRRATAAGADAYVTKPDLDGLLEKITQFLPGTELTVAAV